MPAWGFLMDRIDQRHRRLRARARLGGALARRAEYEIVPNGVLIPDEVDPGGARAHDRLRGPARAAQGPPGAAARVAGDPPPHGRPAAVVAGADPLAVRLLLTRLARPRRRGSTSSASSRRTRSPTCSLDEGARRAVARRRELRHGADPCVRLRRCPSSPRTSPGYREVMTPETVRPVAPGRAGRARRRRRRRCSPTSHDASRWASLRARSPIERYSWADIARRLEEIYERVDGRRDRRRRAA